MDFELWIGGSQVSANLVELPNPGLRVRDQVALIRAEMRLPVKWVLNEFSDLARESGGIELSEETVTDWVIDHLRQHPDDIFVFLAMLRQAEGCPQKIGISRLFSKKTPVPDPAWRWIETDSVMLAGGLLTIHGACQHIVG